MHEQKRCLRYLAGSKTPAFLYTSQAIGTVELTCKNVKKGTL